MKNAGRYFLLTVALMSRLSLTVPADTLELKDGRLLDGDYMGGTRSTIRFQTEDRVEVISTGEVLALTFSDSGLSTLRAASASSRETASTQPSTSGAIRVPAGTRLLVRLAEGINSGEDGPGSRFIAILEANLEVNGDVLARRGSKVYGRLAYARRGGRAFGKAELQLELTDIVIDDHRYPIITDEYEIQGRSQGTAKKTFGGAVLGALIDGSDGAKKGAAAGLGLSLLSKGKQVSISSGTLIDFRLQQPLTLQA